MALKYWAGSVPSTRAAWTCPTCGAKNVNPVEDGCPTCKAGADAAHVAGEQVEVKAGSDFERWWEVNAAILQKRSSYEIAESAFLAGRQSVQGVTTTPESSTGGGWVLALVSPETKEPTLTDQRTHDTIIAALAFYRDNQLGYGPVPGQLGKEDVTALIAKLMPAEAS